MLQKPTKVHAITIAAAIVFLATGFLSLIEEDVPSIGASSLSYSLLIIIWDISLDRRLLCGGMKKCLVWAARLMLLFMLMRTSKYCFFNEDEMIRRVLWYSYYIPLTFVPLLMLFSALFIDKQNENAGATLGKWKLLYIPAVILASLVLTNDLHELAFNFHHDFMNWNVDYSHSIVYYVCAGWIVALLVSTFTLVLIKCRVKKTKRFIFLPAMSFVFALIYVIAYNTNGSSLLCKLYELPEVCCFVVIVFYESAIQTGLVPSNVGYAEFFEGATLSAQLADQSDKICVSAKNALVLSDENMQCAKIMPVIIDADSRLNSRSVCGRRIFWTDDLSKINHLNAKLSDTEKKLNEYNDVLRTEADIKKRSARSEEKKRLYDKAGLAVRIQLNKLCEIIDSISGNDPEAKQKYAYACILNAYIKRRMNLALISENAEKLNAYDLESCIRESVEYIGVYGIPCTFARKVSGEFAPNVLICAYEFFESTIECAMPTLSAALVNLTARDGELILKISVENANALVSSIHDDEKYRRIGAQVNVVREDETTFLTFHAIQGGEKI